MRPPVPLLPLCAADLVRVEYLPGWIHDATRAQRSPQAGKPGGLGALAISAVIGDVIGLCRLDAKITVCV